MGFGCGVLMPNEDCNPLDSFVGAVASCLKNSRLGALENISMLSAHTGRVGAFDPGVAVNIERGARALQDECCPFNLFLDVHACRRSRCERKNAETSRQPVVVVDGVCMGGVRMAGVCIGGVCTLGHGTCRRSR